MRIYYRSNLAVQAEQMNEDFVLEGQQEKFYGQKGDYIVYENGRRRGYRKEDFEQEFIDEDLLDERTKLILQMYSGYRDPELHQIYKDLENDFAYAERETMQLIEKGVKEFT